MLAFERPPERKRGGSSLLQAIWAAGQGFAVLEISRGGKVPARKWRDLGFRSTALLVSDWNPRCDVGVMTGPSDLVDIESDGPHGQAMLGVACDDFPDTLLTLKTDSGSVHWIFRAGGKQFKTHSAWRIDSCQPHCQLDVRGRGGYFLLFADDRRITSYGE